MLKHNLLLLISFVFSNPLLAGQVIHSDVSHRNHIFNVSLEMQIEAPSNRVYGLFTDFNFLSRLNDNIRNSEIIDAAPPEYTVLIETHNCVLFFCKDLQQTQQVTELGDGYISVEDIPGQSDFVFAHSHWHIYAHGTGTRITFTSEMKPDFWLPPLLGAWIFKRKLVKETKNMIEQLERLARHE